MYNPTGTNRCSCPPGSVRNHRLYNQPCRRLPCSTGSLPPAVCVLVCMCMCSVQVCVCQFKQLFKKWIASRQSFFCAQVTFDFQMFDLCDCSFINMWKWMWLSTGTQRFSVNPSRDTASQAESHAWGHLTNLTSCLYYLSVCAQGINVNCFCCSSLCFTTLSMRYLHIPFQCF